MTKDDVVVGHVPRNISTPCSIFLRNGGSIHSTVNGTHRYSRDSPQGYMEIPCLLYFSGDEKNVKNLSNLFKNSGRDKWHRKCEENVDEEICEEKDASISCEKETKTLVLVL